MKTLYGLTDKEVLELVGSLGLPKYRAAQLLGWVYQKNALAWEEIKNLPKAALQELSKVTALVSLEPFEEKRSADGSSVKFLFKTRDGHLLESVLISNKDRQTVCVSTQLGCKIRCAFCASGQGGFVRDLTAGEIVEQVARVSRMTGKKITNVVFMGMGEPLDNFDATFKAVHILIEPWGFAFGARRVTVSTSGIVPKILDFVKSVDGRVRLSVSLHSSIEEVRTKLVPINKRYPLKELLSALRKVNQGLKREITFEYTLIAGVNDSDEEAEGVAMLARPLHAKINIIPYNPVAEFDHKAPSPEAAEHFCAHLKKLGLHVTLRQTEGKEIDAACGQLRLDRAQSAERSLNTARDSGLVPRD
ncbi:MAG TPA: 23S rRNA (adenine(2503)-C(2))-methyltransferase RlmN [Candidatus Omnitrophota bacterium]|nr:23S rRNA (adenine(2503)-C(2))-methyltransferase RlmN [Candidatus Omnitrophota bacterium]HRY85630.1 23S rRNA (adenine(2503)-C(2))-methyltransferase RlmN [Candidatus Omnitrophota bacterium]